MSNKVQILVYLVFLYYHILGHNDLDQSQG